MLDYSAFSINEDFTLIGLPGSLRTADAHPIGTEYLH
jgi:hypothetical protein